MSNFKPFTLKEYQKFKEFRSKVRNASFEEGESLINAFYKDKECNRLVNYFIDHVRAKNFEEKLNE